MQIYSDKIFKNPCETIEVFCTAEIKNGLNRIEKLANKGLYLLGYIRYDLSKALCKCPIIYFEAYKGYEKFIPQSTNYQIGVIIEPLVSKEEYIEKVNYIKEQIKNGITYELNYTYPFIVKTNASERDLYNYLITKQKTPYNAFLKNKYETILSFSPELFFTLNGKKILTKPMKGTIRRGCSPSEDIKLKSFLHNDVKNRAENIMIVDLLRNDLSRISKTGSIRVDKLFEIEEHETLFQMTSEISSVLEEGTSLYDIIKALFPCGSITGAPKISTMKVIFETEKYNREVYCGAIGYLHNKEAVFSVPIRILQKKTDERAYKFFTGSAIVWDSNAQDEWEETIVKTKFLQTEFSLIETCIDDFDLHIERLKNSAKALGFVWNANIEKLIFKKNVVTRIELFKNGEFKTTTRAVMPKIKNPKIKIKGCINSSNPFVYHKTSIRDKMPQDVFEEIRVNEKGQITEGIFTNIAIKQGENIYTPPVECGLLNGIARQKLIKSAKLKEKILYESDLKKADKIFCFNSIRGIIEVELC